jgi:hypothetical protein
LKTGVAGDAQNWECALEAGYSRSGGYDKYVNGKTASEMVFKVAVISVATGLIMSGETLTGASSGATMVFGIGYEGNDPQTVTAGMTNVAIYVTDIDGQFTVGEMLYRDAGLSSATIYLESLPEAVSTGTPAEVEEARATAEAAMRTYMDKPGSGVFSSSLVTNLTRGATLGVFVLSDIPYVVRAKNPALTTTGNTNAVFIRPATPDDSVNRYWEVATDQALIPTDGANFEFVLSNFADPAGPKVAYGVSGTYKAFVYTGAAFSFVTTGMTDDRPSHLAVHGNRLWLSFKGSLQYSALNDPLTWSPVLGAGELAMGSDITGLLSITGSENKTALLVSTESKLFIVYGSGASDFQLIPFSDNTGALPNTLQWMGQPIFQNIFGLTQMTTSSAFGGFRENTISAPVKTFLDARRGAATASMICRDKNQYRIFFGTSALYVTFRDGRPIGMFIQKLKHSVTCAWSCVLSDNTELLLIGTEDGGIYKMDVGTSFAGETIPHYIRMAYNHFKSPRIDKYFRRTIIEARSNGYAKIQVGYDLDYGGNRRDVTEEVSIESPDFGSGGFWDDGTWDVGYWDGATSTPFVVDTPGTGGNLSIRFQGDDAISSPVNITGVTIDYTVRRAKRGI